MLLLLLSLQSQGNLAHCVQSGKISCWSHYFLIRQLTPVTVIVASFVLAVVASVSCPFWLGQVIERSATINV